MKFVVKLFALVVCVGLFNSCENEDDYVPPYNEVSSLVYWSSPASTSQETEKTIGVGNYIAFKDLSRGVVTHEWKIQEGSHFMNGGFTEADSLRYTNFIKPNAGLSTSERLAYVLFTEAGVKEVTLSNTFKDSVTDAFKEGSLWKVNKVFTITVAD
ncbi:hypothetical protein [Seonamhaeicola marinus]|uniref:Uncharacterized protein n=1 Tax=Seonamhaeicola marinus TaxID=1912246 RepID=A0A5D0HQS2_9FLAO|nr:hypothetical protein [Seonamhaeicola marinus]TYA71732.1 hypothetical protein FUA24_19450 [Seonamhaeicola marinus]